MRVGAVAVLVALALGACGGDEAPGSEGPPPGGAKYDSLEEVAEAADCADVEDVGTANNPGLEEFGICHVGRANIDIYLTSDRSAWEHLAEMFPSVLGPNWVIVSPSGAEGARAIHEKLGGELKIPPSPTPT